MTARDDPPPLPLPVARLAPARQSSLPRLCGGWVPARVATGLGGPRGAARLHPRAGAGDPRGRRAATRGAAAPGRPCAAGSSWTRSEFYATFYCASVTRCYPGKPDSGRGDRTPTPREQQLCEFWRDWELRLLEPELILTVGGIAARRLLGISSLGDCVGSHFDRGGACVVPLPHPSGASGWLNAPANRARLDEALALVREQLRRLAPSPS